MVSIEFPRYVMEIAVILSAGLQDWIDFGVIVSLTYNACCGEFRSNFGLEQIGILMLNAGVGWYQEKQAGDIVEQLKKGIAMKAWVCVVSYSSLVRKLL